MVYGNQRAPENPPHMLMAIAPLRWDRELQSSLHALGFAGAGLRDRAGLPPSQGSGDSQALGQPVSRAYICPQLQRAV